MARLNMGEAKDDIHVCILCMRAIMNNKVNIKKILIQAVVQYLILYLKIEKDYDTYFFIRSNMFVSL